MRAIASLKKKIIHTESAVIYETEIKLWNKPASVRMAGEHLGLFKGSGAAAARHPCACPYGPRPAGGPPHPPGHAPCGGRDQWTLGASPRPAAGPAAACGARGLPGAAVRRRKRRRWNMTGRILGTAEPIAPARALDGLAPVSGARLGEIARGRRAGHWPGRAPPSSALPWWQKRRPMRAMCIVEGESGILACSPPWCMPLYQPTKRTANLAQWHHRHDVLRRCARAAARPAASLCLVR